jgi:4-amino-4-deoxy-L-arabinose transferase-like glycosyltransferase
MHVAVGIHTALSKSVTHDELWHLPVGLLNLRTGRFGYDNLNPPLTRMWAALPLWLAGVSSEPGTSGPDCGLQFIERHPQDFQRWYVWGRIFNLGLSAATVCLLAWWARGLFGAAAALLATLLYCTCPNIVAHASLVTPDAGLMLGFVATLLALWRWSESRTWVATITLGVVLGLTQATKFTAVLLYPLVIVLALVLGMTRTECADRSLRSRLNGFGQVVVAFIVSLAFLNAVYLFRGVGAPLRSYSFQSSELRTLSELLRGVDGLPVPLPRDDLEGLDAQRAIMASAHPVFLDGRWSVTGFLDYYPRTLLYKLPHPLQALCVLAAALLAFGRLGECSPLAPRVDAATRGASRLHCGRWQVQLLLWLPVVVLLGVASTTAMQLGIRYVLPALPLLMLFAAQCGPWLAARSRVAQALLWTLITAACLASLQHHPHHLPYFNEYTGGPAGGRNHLLDSNLDWGQDLHLVKQFMDEQGLDEIGLAYFGTVPAETLGIRYNAPPSWQPQPGWYAVSVNFVMGRPHLVREPDGTSRGVDLNEFGYFREFEPVARLGHSIDVYHVRAPDRGVSGSL